MQRQHGSEIHVNANKTAKQVGKTRRPAGRFARQAFNA
jgi:hypothetical protein